MAQNIDTQQRSDLLACIYRLKLIITGIVLALLGLLTSSLANWLDKTGSVDHLVVALVQGLPDVFLVTGAIQNEAELQRSTYSLSESSEVA